MQLSISCTRASGAVQQASYTGDAKTPRCGAVCTASSHAPCTVAGSNAATSNTPSEWHVVLGRNQASIVSGAAVSCRTPNSPRECTLYTASGTAQLPSNATTNTKTRDLPMSPTETPGHQQGCKPSEKIFAFCAGIGPKRCNANAAQSSEDWVPHRKLEATARHSCC